MTWSRRRIATVARRDFLYTVRRRAFLFTLVGTPLLYALLMFIVIKPQQAERAGALRNFTALGVVDSSGLFARGAPDVWTDILPENPFAMGNAAPAAAQRFRTRVRRYPDFASAEAALRDSEVTQVLVVPPDYAGTGTLRRYARTNNLFTAGDQRVVSKWIVRTLLAGLPDSSRIDRVTQPLRQESLYALGHDGRFELKNEAREMLDFLLPFALGLLLGLSIVFGGQYLLQGVSEEKESRILESMMCAVSPEELLAGKLIGLGGAGLSLVVGWLAIAGVTAAPMLAMLHFTLPPWIVAIMLLYFLLGYVFYGSLMTGIGAIASNMREAQQFSVWFTFLTFIPFYMMSTLVGHPGSALAVALSMFPPTAPVASMLRLVAPGAAVPAWQIALSLLTLAAAAVGILLVSARLFRVGMLMYGKTPTLPEIVRWLRTS